MSVLGWAAASKGVRQKPKATRFIIGAGAEVVSESNAWLPSTQQTENVYRTTVTLNLHSRHGGLVQVATGRLLFGHFSYILQG